MSASGTIAFSRLAEITGESNVTRDSAELACYDIDGKSPTAAVRPGSEEEVVEIVKFAAREKLAIIPTAARTKLRIGMPPRQYDLALGMTRMDRIVAYDPGDLTLSVEPGTPMHRIASALAEHRQFLPLAVPFMSRATVGGTIASGVDSPSRHGYGTARDFVLGMQFVTGDGIAAKSGGRVVKNVSGYDIHKLMIGAMGTLGVITRVNLRTFPLPRMTRTFVAVFRGAKGACEFRNAIAQSVLRPRSLEILAASASNAFAIGRDSGLEFADGRWSVAVSFAGDEDVLARNRRELESLVQRAGSDVLESFAELSLDGDRNATRLVAEFPADILDHCPVAAIFKISTLPAELSEVASSLQSIETPWTIMMRGLGVAYLALLPRDGADDSIRLLGRECARVFSLAGKAPWRYVVLPWCPAALKREIDVWGQPPSNLALMRKLKNVFDPGGILSPGRFVGGI